MTMTHGDTDRDILRTARRAWFRAGVRRADRRRLNADLAGELESARADGGPDSVLGDDPSNAAREWATALGLTDRRTRIGLLGPSMLVAGVLASGCVLAPVLQAFDNGGQSFLNASRPPLVLAIYCGVAVLSYLAMVSMAVAVLSIVDDAHVRSSVRALSAALPIGGAIACAAGVATADALDFAVRPRTFTMVALVVAAVLLVTIASARARTTREPARPPSDDT